MEKMTLRASGGVAPNPPPWSNQIFDAFLSKTPSFTSISQCSALASVTSYSTVEPTPYTAVMVCPNKINGIDVRCFLRIPAFGVKKVH